MVSPHFRTVNVCKTNLNHSQDVSLLSKPIETNVFKMTQDPNTHHLERHRACDTS